MRTFIAIELPEEIKESLAQLQGRLKDSKADVKWVEPKNIHLTLKFLGEINDEQLREITKILEQVAEKNVGFQMRISSIGVFPKMNFPRVIWVGLDKGDSETKKIATDLEERIIAVGIPREKQTFSSHITIGRVKSSFNRDELVNCLKAIDSLEGKEFVVQKIILFKSILTPKGPTYEALKVASLKAD
ncbi:MAG: RNA 2',3'-cyclic phosphodiesterase [Candidatus Omnitrophota bacterium]